MKKTYMSGLIWLVVSIAMLAALKVAAQDNYYDQKLADDLKTRKSTKGAIVNATLNNGTGDGSLTVTVTPYGTFGHSTDGGSADFDPVGSIGSSRTVFESAIYFSPFGGFLHTGDIDGPALPTTASFSYQSNTKVISAFEVAGYAIELTQELLPKGANGSTLTQKYRITNNTGQPQNFYIIRHVDGDLFFDGTLLDMGGVRENGSLLYEFDRGDMGDNPPTFFGIRSQGGLPIGYRIAPYRFTGTILSQGRAALTDAVYGDTNGDGLTDSAYDVTLSQGNEFSIAAGGSVNYVTTTIWGSGAASADIEWDEERCQQLFGTTDPIRVVQVVDVDNQKLVADKPAAVRVYLRGKNETDTAKELVAKLYVDGALKEQLQSTVYPKNYFSQATLDALSSTDKRLRERMMENGSDTFVFGRDGQMTFSEGNRSIEVKVFEIGGTQSVLSRTMNSSFRSPTRGITLVRVRMNLLDGFSVIRPDTANCLRASEFMRSVYPTDEISVTDSTVPYLMLYKVNVFPEGVLQNIKRNGILMDVATWGFLNAPVVDLAAAWLRGDKVITVGMAPDEDGIFGTSSGSSIVGYTGGGETSVQRANDTLDMTIAHEVGHMNPIWLDDTYTRTGAGSQDPGKTPIGVRDGGSTKAFNPSNDRDSTIPGDDNGVYAGYGMGGFDLDYTHPSLSYYSSGKPVYKSNRNLVYGFMGASGSEKWAEVNEYNRLCDVFIPSPSAHNVARTKGSANMLPAGNIAFVRGTIKQDGSVNFMPVVYDHTSLDIPRASSGDYAVVVKDSNGMEIDRAWFDIQFEMQVNGGVVNVDRVPFIVPVSFPSGARAFILVNANGTELARLQPSPHAPTVVINQQTMSVDGKSITLRWTGTDIDDDSLVYSLRYSRDGGGTTALLMSGLSTNMVTIPLDALPGTLTGVIVVLASDGYLTGTAQTASFVVPGHNPEPVIISHHDGSKVPIGKPIRLVGRAFDQEEGQINQSNLVWSVDGVEVGRGGALFHTFASAKQYQVRLSVADSESNVGEQVIAILAYDEIQMPTADAGPDQSRAAGTTVVLDGSFSTDPNLDDLHYQWRQIGGTNVHLSATNVVNPTFTMPYLAANGYLTFELVVSDGVNVSIPDTVVVSATVGGSMIDTTSDMTTQQQNWRLDRSTGALLVDFQLQYNPTVLNKPNLRDAFWVVLPDSPQWRLAQVSGLTPDGRPYYNVTASIESQLLAAYGRVDMHPGDSVTVTIPIFSRDRTIPPIATVYSIWADPPASTGGGSSTLSDRPHMGVTSPTPGMIMLSWQATKGQFVVEETDNLSSGNWRTNSTSAVIQGNTNTVTIPTSTGAKFYRLRQN